MATVNTETMQEKPPKRPYDARDVKVCQRLGAIGAGLFSVTALLNGEGSPVHIEPGAAGMAILLLGAVALPERVLGMEPWRFLEDGPVQPEAATRNGTLAAHAA